MINSSKLLVRLPGDPRLPYEYYAKIDSEQEMVDWISSPLVDDLIHIDKSFYRKYENVSVDGDDAMFQFKALTKPSKSIQMIVAGNDHGDKKIGIEASALYPEMVRMHLPETDGAHITIYKCMPADQVFKIERRLEHVQKFLKKTVLPVGLASVTTYDPISGKCQIWIQNNFEQLQNNKLRYTQEVEPVVLGSKIFNLHEMHDISAVFKWAKETCAYVLNADCSPAP